MNGNKLTSEQLNIILETIRLAPSCRGLQPYKVFIIEDRAIKAKIQPIADNQPQVAESHLGLLFTDKCPFIIFTGGEKT